MSIWKREDQEFKGPRKRWSAHVDGSEKVHPETSLTFTTAS